jgi:SSS family solute:Na+ symporter
MSTVSGLVNSTSTIVTLDLAQHWKRSQWSEAKLVGIGRWSGAIALLIGAVLAPIVMRWQNIFRYAQDLWAPMAAPVVVVFLAGALWKQANERGAMACLWLSLLSVPFTLIRAVLADRDIHFLASNLENPMVFAGAYALISVVVMVVLSKSQRFWLLVIGLAGTCLILWGAAASPSVIAALLLVCTIGSVLGLILSRRTPARNLWDCSMLSSGRPPAWYADLWLWWGVLAAILIGLYVKFW